MAKPVKAKTLKKLSYEEFLDIVWREPLGPVPENRDAPLYRHLFRELVKCGIIEAKGEIPEVVAFAILRQVTPVEARLVTLERRVGKLEEKRKENKS